MRTPKLNVRAIQIVLWVSILLALFLFVGNSQVFAGAGYDGGFVVSADSDENFLMKVNGFSQARFTFFSPDDDNADSQGNFHLGLGRISLSGKAFDSKTSYFFQIEGSTFGNTNNISFIDWSVSYEVASQLSITTGRFILPYSRQFYTHPGNLLFTDLSATDFAFNLPRAIGVMASGSQDKVSYGVGIVNNIAVLDAGPGVLGESNPPGGELSFFGRVELAILEPYGYMETTARLAAKPTLSIGVAAARNEIDRESGLQNVAVGDITNNVTVDVGFRLQALTLQGAFHFRAKEPIGGVDDLNDTGFYAQAGFQVMPEKFEVGTRVSMVDFEDVSTTFEYTVGCNYYLSGHNLKIQVDGSLIHTELEGTAESTNDFQIRAQTQILF